jgi:hypothetical protein
MKRIFALVAIVWSVTIGFANAQPTSKFLEATKNTSELQKQTPETLFEKINSFKPTQSMQQSPVFERQQKSRPQRPQHVQANAEQQRSKSRTEHKSARAMTEKSSVNHKAKTAERKQTGTRERFEKRKESSNSATTAKKAVVQKNITPISYADFDYAANPVNVDGTPATGKIENEFLLNNNQTTNATGLSFEAVKGKAYKITATFEIEKPNYMEYTLAILKDGNLGGYIWNDYIWWGGVSGEENEATILLTMMEFYIAEFTGTTRFLLLDWMEHQANYTITIMEFEPGHYTELDYTQNTIVLNTLTKGLATAADDLFFCPYGLTTGKPFNFTTEADTWYKITLTFSTTGSFDRYAGLYAFNSSGEWKRNWDDVLSDFYRQTYRENEITVTGYTYSEEALTLWLLLYDNSANDYDFTILVEKTDPLPSYADIDYEENLITVGEPLSGQITDYYSMNEYGDWVRNAAGFSFEPEAGKNYLFSVKFEIEHPAYMDYTVAVLQNGELTGENLWDETVRDFGNRGQYTKLTLHNAFRGTEGTMRFLLLDWNGHQANYTITITEVRSYAEIDYAENLITVGEPLSGQITDYYSMNEDGDWVANAAGFSFEAEAWKSYQFSVKFEIEHPAYMEYTVAVFQDGELTGEDLWRERAWDFGDDGPYITELTLHANFLATGGTMRFLLLDWQGHQANYTITITEIRSYAELDYAANHIELGETYTGQISEIVEFRYFQEMVKGLSFTAEKGEKYQIICTFSTRYETCFSKEIAIFRTEELQGNNFHNEDITWIWEWYDCDTTEQTLTGYFTAEYSGLVRMLLFDYDWNRPNYSITITKIPKYTELDYSTPLKIGVEYEGSYLVSECRITNFGVTDQTPGAAVPAAFRFPAEIGKNYSVTINYETDPMRLMQKAFTILTGETPLSGNFAEDFVAFGIHNTMDEYGAPVRATELTVKTVFPSPETGDLRLVLMDVDQVFRYMSGSEIDYEVNYTILIEEIEGPPSYIALDYEARNIPLGDTAKGTLSPYVSYVLQGNLDTIQASEYSFQAEIGKEYLITAQFELEGEPVEMLWGYEILILKDGRLSGEIMNDRITAARHDYHAGDKTLTIVVEYTPLYSGTVRFALVDLLGSGADYFITVEETDAPILYVGLDYVGNAIPVNGEAVTGTLTDFFRTDHTWVANGDGFSFEAEKGATYRITSKLRIPQKGQMEYNLIVLCEQLGGESLWWDNENGGYAYAYNDSLLTLTFTHEARYSGMTRLVLIDVMGYQTTDYEITVEKLATPVSYTKIPYPALTLGTPEVGLLDAKARLIINPYNDRVTGRGYSFEVEKGKTYDISVQFIASEASSNWWAGFFLLNGNGALTGNPHDDFISERWGGPWNYGTSITLTQSYTAGETGAIRLLLGEDTWINLSAIVTVTESATITLQQLLDRTTKTIDYAANLLFTDRGVMTDLVHGNRSINFGETGYSYYTVAYKITLEAGQTIQIYSSKEGNSYLTIYKADGAGGYTYVAHNDDGGTGYDSYLRLTITSPGDYYMVITDYHPNVMDRYYLSVWNSGDTSRPYNHFGTAPVITTASLPAGMVGIPYTAEIDAISDSPVTWNYTGIPDGLEVDEYYNWIEIFGTPTTAGTFTATITATNDEGADSTEFTILIMGKPEIPAITIETQPTDNLNFIVDNVIGNLTIEASVTQSEILSYRWFSNSTNSNEGGTRISNATSANYTIPANLTLGTYYYFCEVSATGGAKSVRSNVAVVTVVPLVHAAKPTITAHPQSANYDQNATATALSVTANSSDGGTLSFEWYRNTVHSTIGGTSAGTGPTYTPSTATVDTAFYYVVITNTNNNATGTKTATDTGDIATIIVKIATSIVDIEQSPTLSAHTQNGNLYITGLILNQQWYMYNMMGFRIYQGTANSNNVELILPIRGTYIIRQGSRTVKIVY